MLKIEKKVVPGPVNNFTIKNMPAFLIINQCTL